MPANCAVATCGSWARKEKKRADLGLSFFRFPKDPVIQAAWVHRCARQDFIYTKTASVCSLHFTVEDYDPSYLVKRNLMPNVKPRLKPDAIPSQNIPSHPTRYMCCKNANVHCSLNPFNIPPCLHLCPICPMIVLLLIGMLIYDWCTAHWMVFCGKQSMNFAY